VLWVGVFLVVLAFSAWIFGEFYQRGRTRRWLGMALSVGFLLLGYGWILERQLNWRSRPALNPTEGASGVVTPADPEGIAWKPWSPEAVQEARAAGKVVFVD